MTNRTLPNEAIVSKITQMAMRCFRSFGGGQDSKSLLSVATKDSPPIFALGVDISEVVTMVLTMAAYEDLLKACKGAQTAIYDAMHAGNLSREYGGGVIEDIEAAIKQSEEQL